MFSWLTNAWRVPELRKRVLFTAMILVALPARLVDAGAGRRLGSRSSSYFNGQGGTCSAC